MKVSNLIRSCEHYLMGYINIDDIEETNTDVSCDKLTEERLVIAERNNRGYFEIKIMNHALNYSKPEKIIYCPLDLYPLRYFNEYYELAQNLFDSMITKAFELIECGQISYLENRINEDFFSFCMSCYYQGTMQAIPFIYCSLIEGVEINDDRLIRFKAIMKKYNVLNCSAFSSQMTRAKIVIKEIIKKSKLMLE